MKKFYFTEEEKSLSKAKALISCVRRMIASGELSPGDRLPSTQELSAQLDMSIANVQRSLSALVHEGILVRRPHYGTLVCETEKKLKIVAIISFIRPECGAKPYLLSQAGFLAVELHKRGYEVITLTEDMDKPDFDRLEQTLRETKVQGIIPLDAPARLLRRFLSINMPLATTSGVFKDNGVYADFSELPRMAEEILKKEGKKRLAVISQVRHDTNRYPNGVILNRMLDDLRELIGRYSPGEEETLFCMSSWYVWNCQTGEKMTEFAYNSTMKLLSSPKPPDSLMITSDELMNGVTQAILQTGKNVLLIGYRNREVAVFSPLSAYYLEISQKETALALIQTLEKQFQGEKTERKLIHFNMISPK